jgi:hypothetical protein
MNKDLDARLLSAGEYRDGNNVSVSRSEGADVGALENILGNKFLNDLQKSTPNPCQVIGWHIDQTNDRIFIFLTNYQDNNSNLVEGIDTDVEQIYAPLNSDHKIVYFNTKTETSTTIVSGKFLNFSINSPILNTNMIENLLFFTDNRNQPRKINVNTAIEDPTYYYNEDHISVAKYYPFKPISLYNELVINDCVFVDADMDNFNTGPPTPAGYSAIYPYFFIDQDSLSTEIINTLENNIGVRATITDAGGNIWDFRVAWFQLDGDTFSSGTPLHRQFTDQNSPRKYLIFPNRDLSSANLFKYTNTASGGPNALPANGDYGSNKYTIKVYEETTKNVSDPWSTDSAGKLKVSGITGVGFVEVGDAGTTFADTPNFLFIAGTRSLPINQTNTAWSGYFETPGDAATDLLSFYVPNAFPTNIAGNSRNAYLRVKHPKIPETDYVVISGIFSAPIPIANSPAKFTLPLFRYSSLSNGGSLVGINPNTEYGLAAGDIVDVYYPNKYYNSTFPGDPTFTNDKFIRFSYRYKYDDGEYSILAPFSQSVFIPRQHGIFQKRLGNVEQNTSENNLIPQEQIAGQNTIVDFFVNSITEARVKVPLECAANELSNKFKVQEVDIIYKESDGLSLKVAQTIDVSSLVNTDNFITYKYQSRKPIKTLPTSEISRVYDNVPIRAMTQSTSGNRIIYGNFVDRHTSPLTLNYMVGYGRKFMPSVKSSEALYNQATVAYPTHTVKHNRTYQVGIILSDRYGRSSDVILSNIGDNTVVDTTFPGNPITFGGSTLYVPYDDDMNNPNTAQSSILTTKTPVAGITDWPGDALKIRWNSQIPSSITSNPGYPGLYEEVITKFNFNSTAGTNWIVTTPAEITKAELSKPGMYLRWSSSGTVYDVEIKEITSNGATNFDIIPAAYTNVPAASDIITVYKKNPLGFYSYRVVVKQQEQDYYNVYLPSLLDGNPVVKPFKLEFTLGGPAEEGVCTVQNGPTIPAADPKTFLLLEGMVFEEPPGTEYVITNILNNENFTVSPIPPAKITNAIAEFTTRSSKNTINVTTLLTDNANKVPPALIETTPVQQQYSTSDVKLIPRVALQANYTASNTPFFTTGTERNRYIYPSTESVKVRSLGNFENMFVDASYAGLWQADTDPPTGVIENKFQLGQNAETVLPVAKQALQFSCYETTPTISELDIYYETSTAFDIYDLNEQFAL